jgi:hypothetical protein
MTTSLYSYSAVWLEEKQHGFDVVKLIMGVRVMVFNATFNNISAIS